MNYLQSFPLMKEMHLHFMSNILFSLLVLNSMWLRAADLQMSNGGENISTKTGTAKARVRFLGPLKYRIQTEKSYWQNGRSFQNQYKILWDDNKIPTLDWRSQ